MSGNGNSCDIGDLQLVSKHKLIDGFPQTVVANNTKVVEHQPFVRDCGCVCRFTASVRKNRLRSAIRERKGSKGRGSIRSQIDKEKEEDKTTDVTTESRTNRTIMLSRENSIGDDEVFTELPITNKSVTKRYETKCYFDFKTVPVNYKTTLLIPEDDDLYYKEKVYFKRKVFQSRVVEKVSVTCNDSKTFTSTYHFNVSDHYIDLEPQQLAVESKGIEVNEVKILPDDERFGISNC